ncbi:MAG TPA: orotidine-5'-phosphate decarboxylase [Intrasporangium sp.]|uniref:orotidine-5'-phosphate decarboxylase n=1 Tax=Intrasporangium sp. TaxID=1925024 RepID=UPI002D76A5AB|nr:orotidine-5'-phosphate decarboxylase [Intrasporangium sp.]HET7399487.1 orotidine-5'-phosphate decarboxylase [Intrasporangium sp.]
MRATFGARLRLAMAAHGPLCVGIDPHRSLLDAWGLPQDTTGLERFAMTCVEAFAGQVAAVKPQSAFFEVFGSAGVAVLERVLRELAAAGTLSILDVKRGDIGTTMAAYAEAFLGPDAPAAADAITLSPFLGYESLRPALDLAQEAGRGVFVLTLTSNPEGAQVQHALRDGRAVAGTVVDGATVDNAPAREEGELGSVGLVIGATVGTAVTDLGLDLVTANAPILAPGVGAQGGSAANLDEVFGAARGQVLASSSREVLAAGPSVRALTDHARRLADSLRA